MSFNVNFGPSFSDYFQRLVKVHLGDEYTFVEVYDVLEEGVFITVKDAQDAQHIYVLVDGELELVDRL